MTDDLYRKFGKPCLDRMIAAAGILLLVPFWIGAGIAIPLDSRGPVLFRQRRIGRDGKPFICLKLRTMTTDAPDSVAQKDFVNRDRYLTGVGRFLRETGLDELPQLFNVLMGQMSLVGPRPLIPAEGEINGLRRRLGALGVRPGITGLAQILGRDQLSDPEKLFLDLYYADHLCPALDREVLEISLESLIGIGGNGGRRKKIPASIISKIWEKPLQI